MINFILGILATIVIIFLIVRKFLIDFWNNKFQFYGKNDNN